MGTSPGGDDAGPDATTDVVGGDVVGNDVTVDAPGDVIVLDAPGDAPADAADGGVGDGGDAGDAGVDASDGGSGCDASVPDAGVVMLPTGDAGCPMGSTQQNFETNPQAGAGSCTCGACTPTADPTCGGNLAWAWGSSNQCGAGNQNYSNVTNNACTSFGFGSFNLANYNEWGLKNPVGGTCTAPTIADTSKVTTTSLRACVANAPAQVCAAQQAGGFRYCIDAQGACSGAYSVAMTVGTGPSLSCAACGCTRGATGCSVDYYGSSNCTTILHTAAMDGTCTTTNGANGVSHFKVHASGLTCTATPGAATPGLANARNLCCTP
jgi:hypothetical protein